MKIDPNKSDCICIHFTRKVIKTRTTLLVNEYQQEIKSKTRLNYLEVELDTRILFCANVNLLLQSGNAAFCSVYPFLTIAIMTRCKVTFIQDTFSAEYDVWRLTWSGVAKHVILNLQRLQIKVLRYISGVDGYVGICRLHELLKMEYFDAYVMDLSNQFFSQCRSSATFEQRVCPTSKSLASHLPNIKLGFYNIFLTNSFNY